MCCKWDTKPLPTVVSCGKGEECGEQPATCVKACPGTRCGKTCCKRNERCKSSAKGLCEECPPKTEACGKKCCSKTTFCCDPKQGLCCKKKGGSCCGVGSATAPRWICCNEPNECAPPANEEGLKEPGTTARVCCPPERLQTVTKSATCCPPGYRAMDKLIVTSGLCCRADKVCGSTCCRTSKGDIKDFEQECCGGTCRSVNVDPQNCGGCGRACAPGQGCVDGVCR